MNQSLGTSKDVKTGFKFGLGFVAAALLLKLLTSLGKNGNGGMAIKMAGGVTVRGRLSQVITLGNDISKQPGDPLVATVTFTNATTNSTGSLISWPMRIRIFSGATPDSTFATISPNPGPGESRTGNVGATIDPATVPGPYQIGVELQAAISNNDGTPGSGWVTVDTVIAGTVTVGGPAIPGGSIGNVVLSNRFRHALRK